MNKIGENIRRLREERGWTQQQLSQITGINDKYLSALERGVRNPQSKTITKLSEAFAVDEMTLRFGERQGADKDLQELQQEVERVFGELGANDLASKHHFLAEMHRKIKALYEEGRKG